MHNLSLVTLWNDLPPAVSDASSVDFLKGKLKLNFPLSSGILLTGRLLQGWPEQTNCAFQWVRRIVRCIHGVCFSFIDSLLQLRCSNYPIHCMVLEKNIEASRAQISHSPPSPLLGPSIVWIQTLISIPSFYRPRSFAWFREFRTLTLLIAEWNMYIVSRETDLTNL